MERLIRIILLSILRVPGYYFRLSFYDKHVNEYSEELRFQMVRRMAAHVCKAGKITVKVSGMDNLPEKSGYMLYPNHQGMFDVIALLNVITRPFSVVYKKELKNIIILKQAFGTLQAKAIDRSDIRQSMRVVNEVAKEVSEGRNYVLFPEGTRYKDKNNVHTFKPGSFKIATKTKCPIVPVALVDAYKALDDKGTDPLTVQVHILPSIAYDEYKDMNTTEISRMVQNIVQNKINEVTKNSD